MHPPGAASLLLSPMTRHADATTAMVWVETSAPCEVVLEAGGQRWQPARSGVADFEEYTWAGPRPRQRRPRHEVARAG